MQGAIASDIALATDVMEAFEQRRKLVEVFQTTNVLFLDSAVRFVGSFDSHAVIMTNSRAWRNTVQKFFGAQIPCRTGLG
jgi:hypothetical protein